MHTCTHLTHASAFVFVAGALREQGSESEKDRAGEVTGVTVVDYANAVVNDFAVSDNLLSSLPY